MSCTDVVGFTVSLVVLAAFAWSLSRSSKVHHVGMQKELLTSLDNRVPGTLMEPVPGDDRSIEADRLKPAHNSFKEMISVTSSSFHLSRREKVEITEVVTQMDYYREHFGALKDRVAEIKEEVEWQGLPIEVLIKEAFNQLVEEGVIE